MIISRTPFRVSLAGGGTDLSLFYRKYGGAVISMSIKKYIYISAHPMFFSDEILLKYSKTERIGKNEEIQHHLFREGLKYFKLDGIDLGVSSDIPSGTGLGSSSAFAVGLCHILSAYKGQYLTPTELAELAFSLENLNSVGVMGKQDQYASSIGGFNLIYFNQDESVDYQPLFKDQDLSQDVAECCYLIYVGDVRSAKDRLNKTFGESKNAKIREKQLQEMYEILLGSLEGLRRDPLLLPDLINKSWEIKRQFASTDKVDELISHGVKKGASAAKLLGAGGGGFVLFYVPRDRRDTFTEAFNGTKILRVEIDYAGSSIIYAR